MGSPPNAFMKLTPPLTSLTTLALFLACTSCRTRPAAEESAAIPIASAPGLPVSSGLGQHAQTRTLFRSPLLSAHATQVSGPVAAHYHADHEETVYVLSGTSRMRLGDEWIDLHVGDLVHIPRGVVHQVETAEPVSVLSLFAPPFFGEDRVFVEEGEDSDGAPSSLSWSSSALYDDARTEPAGFLFLPNPPRDPLRGFDRDS